MAIENSEGFHQLIPLYNYVKRLEKRLLAGTEHNRSCRIVYDDSDGLEATEVVTLHEIEWKRCSKWARKFVSLDGKPVFSYQS